MGRKQTCKLGIFMILVAFIECIVIKFMMCFLHKAKNVIESRETTIGRLDGYFWLYEHWIDMKNKGRNVEDYFRRNHFENIAVYGMASPGCLLCNELRDSAVVRVRYAIDRGFESEKAIVDMRKLTDAILPVDAVVVTVTPSFEAIKKELEEKFDCPIVSLEDVIYSI